MFSKTKGCLYLNIDSNTIQTVLKELNVDLPEEWVKNRQGRDGPQYHMTIIPKKDFKSGLKEPDQTEFYILGYAQKKDVGFLVCHYPAGDRFCHENNLPSHPFHITVGFASSDNHEIKKDFTSITNPKYIYTKDLESLIEEVNQLLKKDSSIDSLQLEQFYTHFSSLVDNSEISIKLKKTYCKYLYQHGKFNQLKPLLIEMLYLPETKENAIFSLLKLNLITNSDFNLIDVEKHSIIEMDRCRKIVNLLNKNFTLARQKYVILDGLIQKVKVPTNFSRIAETLYASGLINSSHYPFLNSLGITSVINLTEDGRTSLKEKIDYHHFPIPDREATTQENVLKIIDLIKRPDHVTVVHCLGGKGRTAMIFYAYLIQELEMDISEIDMKYRLQRDILMTNPQLEFLRKFSKAPFGNDYYKLIKYRRSSKPKSIILVGLPGSGKSTFSKHLQKYLGDDLVYVNQDTTGRKEVNNMVSLNCKNQKLVLIDRCNLTKEDRKEWLSYFNDPVWCLHFDLPPEECFYRVEHRKNHPTLSGIGGAKIAKSLLMKFESPDLKEGFQQVIRVKSETDLNFILGTWKMKPILVAPEDSFFKFPRTVHLYNLGSATRDDLLLDQSAQNEFLNKKVYVEEKIDGANMGISISPVDLSIWFQNRSHFVSNKYHQQFEHIDAWRDQHSSDLFEILEPGRHILFGEWLYLQHSIRYKKLPSYFIAFDLYDKKEMKFYSRPRLEALMAKTNIPLIKCIKSGSFKKISELVDLIQTKSEYRDDDGPVEGVYVKQSDDDQWVTRRGKIVRDDFIGGNQFWDKGIVHKNLLDHY